HSVDDNAYTNWMAWFNLQNALAACRELPAMIDEKIWRALLHRLNLREDEMEHWQQVAAQLFRPLPGPDGVIEQFRGFFALEDYALPARERFRAPINRLFDAERING